MIEEREVVVVGGGPAGAAAAIRLRRLGHDVLLLDAARFPRDKVCGESVSPGAWPLLDELDLGGDMSTLGIQPLHGMRLTAPNGVAFRGEYRAAERPGFAVRRLAFDALLLGAATRSGVDVRQGCRVLDLVFDAAGRNGVRRVVGVVHDSDGGARGVRARLVIAADGRRSVVARRLGLLREHRHLRKFAVRGYWQAVDGLSPFGELHVGRGAYVGIAPLGPGRANVTFVVDRLDMSAARGDLEGFYRRTLERWPRVAERLAQARLEGPPSAIGPLALEASRVSAPGAMLIGDAAGFFDPFTGEGITLGLRSAAWATEVATRALDSGSTDRLSAYDRLRRDATRDKFRLNRLLYEIVARPALANLMAGRLARHPRAADRLVGIAGDFVPAREGLGLGFVYDLLRA